MRDFFYIDEVRVEPGINTITKQGKSFRIEPKIMYVLMCLVEAKGKVVSKQYLFETVWAETIVVEMVLTRAISELRRVFGDKPTSPKYIATISKSGYRLVAEVTNRKPENNRQKIFKITVPVVIVILLFVTLFGFLPSDPGPPIFSSPLTVDKGWEFHPSLSGSGGWVAYVSQNNNNYTDIFLKETEGDSSVKLTSSDGYYLKPVWSPEGTSVAAFGTREGKSGIHIFSVIDKSLVSLIEIKTQYVGVAWSPDGSEISYVAYDTLTSRHSIYKYYLESKNSEIQVEPEKDSWGDSNPRYSPDGKSLAFIRTVSEGNQDIYTVDLTTSQVKRLTQINRNVLGFDWEDGSTLLISSDLDGSDNLWKLDVNSRKIPATLERVIRIPYGESIQNPTVHDGLIVGEKWMKDTDLIISNLNGSEMIDSTMLTSTQWELHPDISRDGKNIVFSSNRSGSYELWKYSFLDQSVTQLTKLEKGFSGKPKWSPDGDLIAFESNVGGDHQIYVINADGSEMKQVTDGEGDYINPSWSQDGTFVYCSSNTDGDWSIWAQSISGGRLRKIESSGGYYLQEAPGLGRTFITRLHQPGIWELKMDGSDERIIDDLSPVDWGSWSVGQKGIYFFNRRTSHICFYDFNKKEVSDLFTLKSNIPGNDPSFSIWEEGGIALYGKLTNYSGDLVAIRNY